MENLVVVLLFVGSIVYKIYSNYKEEMEKSAKRTPQRPTTAPHQHPHPVVEPYRSPSTPPPIPQKQVNKSTQDFVTKSNMIQDIPEEVQRLKEYRKKQVAVVAEEVKEEHQPIAFDLRQAVIQSAILERPYQ
ncbi:hypothetical protein [Sphingobacterium faecale]|uniref:Uncharacterized protein n=1 Tax=Sphingobacterium faecale TaxID=2803775 RepID=A0ABS1QZC3_9SPHI|nr:hypothetical protein [Sphingobacterium faecale]MBL1407792.1 hypothetical protein [Sphingobacterium faecale]